jgi:single-strand DNA-binding protein
MASLNKVMLIGNLTRDPEVRYTPKGVPVCDLAMAVNRRYTTEGGERQEEVTYLDIVLWNKLAELAGQYLHKGRPVFIEGRLQMDTWEDKATGQKRSKIKIVGETLEFLDSKVGGGAGGGGGGGSARSGGGDPDGPPPARFTPRSGPPAGRAESRSQPQPASSRDDFDGPITDGMEEDDIPF